MVLQNLVQNQIPGTVQKNSFGGKTKTETDNSADSFLFMINAKAGITEPVFSDLKTEEDCQDPQKTKILDTAAAAGFLFAEVSGCENITVIPETQILNTVAPGERITVSLGDKNRIVDSQIMADSKRATQPDQVLAAAELPEAGSMNEVQADGGSLQSVELPFRGITTDSSGFNKEGSANGTFNLPGLAKQETKLTEQQPEVTEQQFKVTEQQPEVTEQQFKVTEQQPEVTERQFKVTERPVEFHMGDTKQSTISPDKMETQHEKLRQKAGNQIVPLQPESERKSSRADIKSDGLVAEIQPDAADHAADMQSPGNIGQPVAVSTNYHQTNITESSGEVDLPQTAEFVENTAELIEKAVRSGRKEIEIQLEPEHLGKIIVKTVYESDKTSVVISCSSEKALSILSDHASELGNILQQNMGGETTVVIDDRPQSAWNPDEGGNNSQKQREERQQKKQNSAEYDGDFLQQLRLGII